MKSIIVLLIFFSSLIGIAQVYTSPVTHYLPGNEAEWINRTITFTNDTVFIKTETGYGYKTQKFVVNQITEKEFPKTGG